jgi:imidazolonepropionase-like amidohydrolase
MNRLALLALLTLFTGGAAVAQTTAIVGGTVHTVGPSGTIEDATILVEDGRIRAVGRNVVVPGSARVIDATGKIVTPGLFTPYGRLGLVEVGSSAGPVDSVQRGEAFTAAFDVADAYNRRSTLIAVNRIEGITRALIAPQGGRGGESGESSHVISGLAAVVNLGDDNYLDARGAALVVNFGESGSQFAGGTRTGALLTFEHALEQAADYQVNRNAYERNQHPGYDYSEPDLQVLVRVIQGGVPVLANIQRASDIEALMRVAEAYALDVILHGADEAWMLAEELAAANIPVIMAPTHNLPSNFDRLNARADAAAILADAGVKIAFAGSQSTTHNARNITQSAGNAVAEGLDADAALRAMTLSPAEMFGVAARVGSIEPGKAADIVIWPGDPMDLVNYPEQVFINGVAVPMESRQTLLRDRYLDSGDRPPAFRRP